MKNEKLIELIFVTCMFFAIFGTIGLCAFGIISEKWYIYLMIFFAGNMFYRLIMERKIEDI